MKVLYNWLKDFVDVKASAQELASRLSLAGCNIGAVEDSPSGPVLEADLTTNRPDCLGHYGMAREIAALYRVPLKNVTPKLQEAAEKAADAVRVEIESPELCGRFTARVIRGVKIQPSPAWLRERLEALGQASINNVVDATNYVMLELGHPLHAFDYDLVAEHRLVIRKARPGEKMKTLDGIERALSPNVCMVTDPKRPVGIGGIMGGGETEIRSSTKNVLLECAWFDPIAIRKATKFLKLHTEASLRFGRGADPEMAELASRRCAEVMQQVSGGQILAGVVDVYPRKPSPLKLTMTRAEFLRVMGADVPDRDIEAIFAALGFAPERADPPRGTMCFAPRAPRRFASPIRSPKMLPCCAPLVPFPWPRRSNGTSTTGSATFVCSKWAAPTGSTPARRWKPACSPSAPPAKRARRASMKPRANILSQT